MSLVTGRMRRTVALHETDRMMWVGEPGATGWDAKKNIKGWISR